MDWSYTYCIWSGSHFFSCDSFICVIVLCQYGMDIGVPHLWPCGSWSWLCTQSSWPSVEAGTYIISEIESLTFCFSCFFITMIRVTVDITPICSVRESVSSGNHQSGILLSLTVNPPFWSIRPKPQELNPAASHSAVPHRKSDTETCAVIAVL